VVRPFGGLISGQAGAFDLWGHSPAENDMTAPVAMYVNLGLEGSKAVGTRALALGRLRQLLDDARALKQKKAAVEARRYRRFSAPISELRVLIPVIEGRLPLVIQVHRDSDILAVLRLAAKQKIRVVLNGAAEAWRVAEQIKQAGVPVLVAIDLNLPNSFETLGARYDNAARLHRAGVVVGFSAAGSKMDVAHNIRQLRQMAGIAVARGLPYRAALAALTAVPARIFGLADKGVLRPGARANIVIWSGDPLELRTRVERLVIGGREIPLSSRQTLLRDRYRRLPVK
jgi:imidazolonepropionase-like amidohydrolase